MTDAGNKIRASIDRHNESIEEARKEAHRLHSEQEAHIHSEVAMRQGTQATSRDNAGRESA